MQVQNEGNLAIIELAMPAAPPVLSEKSLALLAASFHSAAASDADTIVLTGPEGSFLVGADVRYFARCVLSGDLARLLAFTRQGRELFDAIAACSKRVVAWVRGPAIGAGLELALACHHLVAAPAAKFALPETGLGIYPGLGGTQRTPRRIGVGLAKWMTFTGSMVLPENAAQIGLIDAITPATTARDAVAALPPSHPTSPASSHTSQRAPLPDRYATLEQLFAAHSVTTLLDPATTLPTDPHLARAVVQVRSKSPLALQLAEQIIDGGAALPLPTALDLEFSHLAEVFASDEARAGLLRVSADQ